MSDVFISYSRKDIAFTSLLHKALSENGLETWIDWQDIPPSTDWLAEVYEAIEQADTFIFIISETSLASEICGYEIAHAAKNNKRLIPIVINDIDAGKVPPSLSAVNWIFFEEEGEKFRKAVDDLITAITVDQAWLKEHTRLQTRALEWEHSQKDRGYLLKGSDLARAEAWLYRAAGKDPQPTALQTQYILAGRTESTRRQRITLSAVLGGLVIALALGGLAWTQKNVAVKESNQRATAEAEARQETNTRATAEADALHEADARATAQIEAEQQRDEAERQSLISLSREISSKAIEKQEVQPDLALLLAAQAFQLDDNIQTRSGLLTVLQSNTQINRRFLHDHDSWVGSVDFSPDGELMVSGGGHDDILLWDVTAGKTLGSEVNNEPLTGGWSSIKCVVFSPDGNTVAASSAGSIVLWQVTTNGLANGRPLDLPGDSGQGLAFSPDGTTLLTDGPDGTVLLLDVASGSLKASIQTSHTMPINTVQFSPGGDMFATAGEDDQVLLWDTASRTLLKQLSEPISIPEDEIFFAKSRSLAFSPDGAELAAGFNDGSIHVWALPSGRERSPALTGHSKRVFSVDFSPDGRTLVSGGYDDLLIFWDVESGTQLYEPFTEHRDSILSVAYNPSGTMLASASMDSDIILWELNRGSLPPVHTGDIQGLVFSPDGRLLASSGMDNQIVFWDVASGQMDGPPIETVISASSPLLFSPDGKLLVSYCDGLCFYDVESRSLLKQINTYSVLYDSTLAFSPDGTYLASGDGGGIIRLWQPETGLRVGNSQQVFDSEVFALAFSETGSELFAANGYEGRIAIWNLNSGGVEYRTLVSSAQPAFFLRFSPGLQYLATDTIGGASWDEVLIFDPATGEELYEPLAGHTDSIYSLAFSPDNRLLATAGADQTIRLWNTADGQAVGMPLKGHTESIAALAFSPDGSLLASAAGADPIRIWAIDPQAWLAHACEIANRDLTAEEWTTYFGTLPYQETCAGG